MTRGCVELHPDVRSLQVSSGFSGHSLRQTPAIGRAAAEPIVRSRFRTLDLSRMVYDRIGAGRPVRDVSIV